MTDREAQTVSFLISAGWETAERRHLAGDASARRYERLFRAGETAVLMDAPPDQGEDVASFLRIASHLCALGLSAPKILTADVIHGFLILEDLGDDLFSVMTARDPAQEAPLYRAAVDALVHLQAHPPAADLSDASAVDWADAAAFAPDWYSFAITGERRDTTQFRSLLRAAIAAHADGPRVMILRDYHAENLLWLPDRTGPARVGLLDFQLAQMGQPGYDLVSLCQDARRDVSTAAETAMIHRFLDATGAEAGRFTTAYAVLGAQRALRIIGIFARLSLVAGKPRYAALVPRVWAQLQRNLAHPVLEPLAKACADILPEPTASRLERIRDQCGTHARS